MNYWVNIDSMAGQALTPWRSFANGAAIKSGMAARNKRVVLYALSLFMDVLAIVGSMAIFGRFFPADVVHSSVVVVLILAPFFILFSMALKVQSIETLRNRTLGIRRSLQALLAAFLMTALAIVFLKLAYLSRMAFGLTFLLSAPLLLGSEMLFTWIARTFLGGRPTRDVLILDGISIPPPPSGVEFYDIGALGLTPDLNNPEVIDALARFIAPFDRVVIACADELRHAWATLLKGSDVGGEILLKSDFLEGAVAIGHWGNHETLVISRGTLSSSNWLRKRLFDIFVGSAALVFLAPLLILTAIAIKLDSPGPVLFRQRRVGLGNRQFWILKFRSMRTEMADRVGCRSTCRSDPRVTRVGRIIRRLSIDELPQLFNVLLGEMSLVGPRPHALGSLAGTELFWEVDDKYWIRHALKPGITGLAQVRGFRGATDNREELERRIRCDLEYLSNWSLTKDIAILFRTITVILHDKAY